MSPKELVRPVTLFDYSIGTTEIGRIILDWFLRNVDLFIKSEMLQGATRHPRSVVMHITKY